MILSPRPDNGYVTHLSVCSPFWFWCIKLYPHFVHIDLSLNKDNLRKHVLISYALLLLKCIEVVLRMLTYFTEKTTGKNTDYEKLLFFCSEEIHQDRVKRVRGSIFLLFILAQISYERWTFSKTLQVNLSKPELMFSLELYMFIPQTLLYLCNMWWEHLV